MVCPVSELVSHRQTFVTAVLEESMNASTGIIGIERASGQRHFRLVRLRVEVVEKSAQAVSYRVARPFGLSSDGVSRMFGVMMA